MRMRTHAMSADMPKPLYKMKACNHPNRLELIGAETIGSSRQTNSSVGLFNCLFRTRWRFDPEIIAEDLDLACCRYIGYFAWKGRK